MLLSNTFSDFSVKALILWKKLLFDHLVNLNECNNYLKYRIVKHVNVYNFPSLMCMKIYVITYSEFGGFWYILNVFEW